MRKKEILFISSNMDIGGFQKSLLSLLQYFDYERYEVDLLLLSHKGAFYDLIPNQVNLIKLPIQEEYFNSFPNCIIGLLKKKKIGLALYRILQLMVSKVDKGIGGIFLSKAIPKIDKEYDAIIDYNGQHILYYMIDKLNAKKKITYFHSDYNKWPYYKNADRRYYNKVDKIVTVSELCKQSLVENFSDNKNKMYVIENIITPKTVNIFPVDSNNFTDTEFKGKRIVTVGRLCKEKGPDLAILALKRLRDKGFNIQWYWIGPGEEKEYSRLISENGLTGKFKLLGGTNNPYDYMRNADILVFPSRFEGKAVAIEEAKVLNKPIVTTNFSTVKNQLEHNVTGIITEMNAQSLSEGIEEVLTNNELKEKLQENLKTQCTGNANECEKLYEIIMQ